MDVSRLAATAASSGVSRSSSDRVADHQGVLDLSKDLDIGYVQGTDARYFVLSSQAS